MKRILHNILSLSKLPLITVGLKNFIIFFKANFISKFLFKISFYTYKVISFQAGEIFGGAPMARARA